MFENTNLYLRQFVFSGDNTKVFFSYSIMVLLLTRKNNFVLSPEKTNCRKYKLVFSNIILVKKYKICILNNIVVLLFGYTSTVWPKIHTLKFCIVFLESMISTLKYENLVKFTP